MHALVTGASSGIGRALVLELAARGWRVAALSRRAAALEALAREAGPGCLPLPADVSRPAELRACVQRAARELGGLDAVVANAGCGLPGRSAEVDLEAVRELFAVNVLGALATFQAALPHVRRSRRGLLVGISSLAAHRGGPGSGPYNASKAALSRLLETLRAELAGEGIRVLDVRPGFVRTPMTDRNTFSMPFLMEPDAAARRIARAMERRRSHLTLPKRAGLLVGLLRHMPDRLFDRLARAVARRVVGGGES